MADFSQINAEINAKIVPYNNAQDITGKKLNDTLHDMVSAVNEKKQDSLSDEQLENINNVPNKVDKIEGKGLSTNDYTDGEKAKLGALPTASELDTELNKKPGKDGVIAFAKDIVSREDGIGAQFIRRRSAGQLHIGDGTGALRSIHGKSIVWNQLVDMSTARGNAGTITPVEGGYYVEPSSAWGGIAFDSLTTLAVVGHKYLMLINVLNENNDSIVLASSQITPYPNVTIPANSKGVFGTIVTCEAVNDNVFAVANRNTNDPFTIYGVSFIDLTQMFGAGNEPSTAAEFEALYSKSHYPHNEGEIVNLKATKLLTNGFNQWDEQWEVGGIVISTGELDNTVTTRIRTKNYIKCEPNTQYYASLLSQNAGVNGFMCYYDKEGKFLGYNGVASNYSINNREFTTPNNCRLIKFYLNNEYGTTYNHDVCINFSNASLNGQYKPYEQHELTLPAGLTKTYTGADGQTHTWQGLDSAGSAYDEQTPTKNIQRIGVVDMGTLNWEVGYNGFIIGPSVLGAKNNANLICIKYPTGAYSGTADKIICSIPREIVVLDSAYTTAAEFKAAMAGVPLLYERAEPIVTEVPARNFNYFVNDMGQEWILPEGVDEQGVPLTAPFNAVIAYASNVRDTTFHLPENYLSHESTIALLEAMKSANIIASYTMTFDTATNKYNFTITKA